MPRKLSSKAKKRSRKKSQSDCAGCEAKHSEAMAIIEVHHPVEVTSSNGV